MLQLTMILWCELKSALKLADIQTKRKQQGCLYSVLRPFISSVVSYPIHT